MEVTVNMKKLLILGLLSPFLSQAQTLSYSSQGSGVSSSLDNTVTATRGTRWQTLLRPTFHDPVNAFYRFSYDDNGYRFELKISAADAPFVVAKYARLELQPEEGATVTLQNEEYQSACRGCGSRSANADILGVTLTFRMSEEDVKDLCSSFLHHVRLHLADNDLGGTLTLKRSEIFREELVHFRNEVAGE